MEDTIRKDVVDVDQRIFELAARLSSERANVIRNEVIQCVEAVNIFYIVLFTTIL